MKLKKYLLLISIAFFFIPLIHFIYIYLYHDAELVPVKGGSVSEGLVGSFPSLNPLEPLEGNNRYIVHLLYRSLVSYDIEQEKIISDIANCDINNLLYIECYLEDNIKWSNEEPMSSEDIIATYKILQNTDINPIAKSLLSETQIIGEKNIITFKNKKADINFVNVLFQPILPKKVIDEIGEANLKGNFSTIDGIYSGKYKIINVSKDLSLGITKFILEKNEHYNKNPIIIDQLILKLFSQSSDLLKNKDSVNIINDENHLIGSSIPRFKVQAYKLPQHVSLFLNKDNIPNDDLRTVILNQINNENLLKVLGEDKFEVLKNPYLGDQDISLESENKNLENIIAKLGYYKKSKLVEDITKKYEKISEEAKIEKEDTETASGGLIFEDFQKDSEYIILPDFVDKYNFITKKDIILKGVVPENTKEVYINDVKINDFQENTRYFYYKLAENIVEGENKYSISFTIGDEKKVYEEVFFIYTPNKNSLQALEDNFTTKLIEEEKKKQELKKQLESIEQENAPLIVGEDAEKIENLNALDEGFFYNDKGEKFSLTLFYITGENHLEKTSVYIKDSLENIGISVRLRPIQINQIRQFMGGESQDDQVKKEYDMMLVGIHLGYFPFNLFPYLHSSQVIGGYNFGNIRKTSLDILLEELKGNFLTKTKREAIENKILDILSREQIVKSLYTPKINLLVDKSIKDTELKTSYIPYKYLRAYVLDNSYILDKKIINFEGKGFFDFFLFIIKKLYE